MDYAREVLLQCVHLGYGGWIHLNENGEWIVIVEGARYYGCGGARSEC